MAKQQQQQNSTTKLQKGGAQGNAHAASSAQGATDAIALLKADHRKVEELFKQYESASSSDAKARLAKQICNELIIHTRVEEETFYPACRANKVGHDLLDEAQVEHDSAKILVTELMTLPVGSEFYDAKVSVLSEYIKHHVGEEERPGTGVFAAAQAAGLDMNALGQRLQARKQELMTKAGSEGFSPPRPRSLGTRSVSPNYREDQTIARYERERDEQGRFMSDDDDYGYGRSSRGGRDYRARDEQGANYRERDEQGRFMSDDDESAQSGRSYGYGRAGRSSGSGRGQGGWPADPGGRSESSREGWEERGYSRSRGRDYDEDEDRGGYRSSGRSSGGGRGWYGDPQGHSEASREGWEERGYSRSRGRGYDEDEDRGGSRSSGRGRGHGGWFGDPQGHSEASRQGERGDSSRSSRGGGRDYDEDRGRSGGNGDHRGWYGDSRGHAQAARRGWQNR